MITRAVTERPVYPPPKCECGAFALAGFGRCPECFRRDYWTPPAFEDRTTEQRYRILRAYVRIENEMLRLLPLDPRVARLYRKWLRLEGMLCGKPVHEPVSQQR